MAKGIWKMKTKIRIFPNELNGLERPVDVIAYKYSENSKCFSVKPWILMRAGVKCSGRFFISPWECKEVLRCYSYRVDFPQVFTIDSLGV